MLSFVLLSIGATLTLEQVLSDEYHFVAFFPLSSFVPFASFSFVVVFFQDGEISLILSLRVSPHSHLVCDDGVFFGHLNRARKTDWTNFRRLFYPSLFLFPPFPIFFLLSRERSIVIFYFVSLLSCSSFNLFS